MKIGFIGYGNMEEALGLRWVGQARPIRRRAQIPVANIEQAVALVINLAGKQKLSALKSLGAIDSAPA